jgi:hypothetical protein
MDTVQERRGFCGGGGGGSNGFNGHLGFGPVPVFEESVVEREGESLLKAFYDFWLPGTVPVPAC